MIQSRQCLDRIKWAVAVAPEIDPNPRSVLGPPRQEMRDTSDLEGYGSTSTLPL